MTNSYNVATAAGKQALAQRLGLSVAEAMELMTKSGVPSEVALLEEVDIKEIEREFAPVEETAPGWQKAASDTYRSAMYSVRQHYPLVTEARQDVFGGVFSPFPGRIDEARLWIGGERQKLPPVDKAAQSGGLVLAWPGEGDWQAYAFVGGGPLAQLAQWSNRLAFEAKLLPSQSTAFILTGSVILGRWSH